MSAPGTTKTGWDETVEQLHFQARNGKTARILIDAARTEFARLKDDAGRRLHQTEREAADRIAEVERERAQAIERAGEADERIASLAEANQRVMAELKERKQSKPNVSVEVERVQFRFEPHTTDRGYALWRLDELESVITYLRVNGGFDATVLRVDEREVSTSVDDPGYVPTPHKPPQPEPSEQPDRPMPLWRRLTTGGIAGAAIYGLLHLITEVIL